MLTNAACGGFRSSGALSFTGMARHHNGCDSGAGALDFAGRSAGLPFGESSTRPEVRANLHNSSFLEGNGFSF